MSDYIIKIYKKLKIHINKRLIKRIFKQKIYKNNKKQ